jgi:hypothetical protein
VTLPTTIGRSLDLRGCDLSGVTLPTTIGGSLDLRGCDLSGVTLPTTIGGRLELQGCVGPDKLVTHCGGKSRTIMAYNSPDKGVVVSLGCFVGNLESCKEAIKREYPAQAAAEYIAKVQEAFNKYTPL